MESSTADRILEWLRRAPEGLSGPELARRLKVSRAAVWKQVHELIARGYRIAHQNPAGYRLLGPPDRLLPAEIAARLSSTRIGTTVHHFESIDSTNLRAMELARGGAREGEVVIAESQTRGRGRLGRSFFSPKGLSLYCSILLRPPVPPARAPQITLVAGLAVAETIERYVARRPGIKWPNDVRLGELKVSGILTEMEAEADRVLHVVCGIGVNLNVPGEAFPEDLRGVATSLFAATGKRVDRIAFTVDLFAAFERLYDEFLERGLVALRERWNAYSVITGKRVRVEGVGKPVEGEALGIDDDGALRLATPDGEVVRAVAGDVTLAKE